MYVYICKFICIVRKCQTKYVRALIEPLHIEMMGFFEADLTTFIRKRNIHQGKIRINFTKIILIEGCDYVK